MIRISSISNLRKLNSSEFDEIWAIVRSLKSPITGVKQVSELSPSTDLFYRYLNLKKTGQWSAESFKNIYVPQFIYEMRRNDNARNKLNELFLADRAGKNICLLCFCTDETLCHRSIVAGFLQGCGCNVITDAGKDYSRYYQLYLQA